MKKAKTCIKQYIEIMALADQLQLEYSTRTIYKGCEGHSFIEHYFNGLLICFSSEKSDGFNRLEFHKTAGSEGDIVKGLTFKQAIDVLCAV